VPVGRAALDWIRTHAPVLYWRGRNAAALAELYAVRRRQQHDPGADAYDEAFWTFHSVGDWDGFARVVLRYVTARSIVDIGCGHGLAAAAFLRADGAIRVRGFDDSPAAVRRAAATGLTVERLDLLSLPRAGADALARALHETDLAICLEVAEHLPAWHAGKLLALCSAPRHLVFSAAHPNQGGRLHVNEQPADYWIERLEQHGHILDPRDADFRRDVAALDLPWWYARNIHLFARGAV